MSSHPVDLICIQKSNLNSSSYFRIPGFSILRFDCTHFRSGVLSPDATHASGGVIIFVRQIYPSLNFLPPIFLRLTSTLIIYESITPPRFLSLMFMFSLICSFPTDSRTDSFHSFLKKSLSFIPWGESIRLGHLL